MAVNLSIARAGNPFIEIRQLTLRLASGRVLLDAVSHSFGPGLTGVVGANGAGKSMLVRCIAGLVHADTGQMAMSGRVHHVAQQLAAHVAGTVADVAGLGALHAASARMDTGHATAADFDLLDGRWAALAEFSTALQACGLGHLAPSDSAESLSGGESTRIALAGAFHSGADWLLLDEPSNHLDRAGRLWLLDSLRAWPGDAIIVSHDRELLDAMDNIVAIEAGKLQAYGGNYSLYRAQCDAEASAADTALAHARKERRNVLREQQERHDALQSRAARQKGAGKDANMPAIVRGKLKSSAQAFAGREAVHRSESRAAQDDAVRSAASRIQAAQAIALLMPGTAVPTARRVLAFESAVPPWPAPTPHNPHNPIDLLLGGPVRLAITGPNGCGKTTLLHMLTGEVPALAGSAKALVPFAWLDQHASTLRADQSVLDALRALDTPLTEGILRSHLALLGLGATQVATPVARLSGGEKLKAALACALWRKEPAQLLLLDEPTNHLDLQSTEALEEALRDYPGAMAIVSHDQKFLNALNPTHELQSTTSGWQLEER
jgi:ATPase subunit of ABC transporter with duplicated ATPase domains